MNTQTTAITELNLEVEMIKAEIKRISDRIQYEELSNEWFESLVKKVSILKKYISEIKSTITKLEQSQF